MHNILKPCFNLFLCLLFFAMMVFAASPCTAQGAACTAGAECDTLQAQPAVDAPAGTIACPDGRCGQPEALSKSRPKELHLKKARSFKGNLRQLPHTRPVVRDRKMLEPPAPNPVYVVNPALGSSGATSAQSLLLPPTPSAPAPAPNNVFEGLDRFNWGAGSPPDTNGDVGPNHYIQAVNTSIGIFRKSDGVREAAFTFDTFMSQGNFGNLCDTDNFGDPVVLYDTFENRWVITDFAFVRDGSGNDLAPAYQCIAASMSGDPITGGWNFYSIQISDNLNDYAKFGIWPDGLYMSANMFSFGAGSSYRGSRVWAINKAQMYAGSPTVQIVSFDAPVTNDFTLLPGNARLQAGTPPAGTPNYFVSTTSYLNALSVYKFHVDWDHISLSTFTGPDVPIAATSWPNAAVANIPQPGTAQLLDSLAQRAMMQNQYTNFGGVESLWVPHTVRRADTTGFAAPRWYQVDVTGSTVAANLPQAATWDPDGANVMHRWMPSLALDRVGNMALGYSTSSSTTFPSIMYAGRLVSDPVNTFSLTEQTFFTGTASQTGSNRWGDYSSMTLDPDGCTFWYTNEYANPADQSVDHRWLTKFGSIGPFPGCTPVGAGGTVSGVVTRLSDSSPIVGATVALGARSTTTDVNGMYNFPNIPAGTYPGITASYGGYAIGSAATIVVSDSATTTRDFALSAVAASNSFVDTTQTDFLAGVPTNVELGASPGDVTLTTAQNIDQQNTAGTTVGTIFGTTSWGGQTFIPSANGLLTRVDINLFTSSMTGTPPNLTLSIRATSGGLPTGPDLASATIPGFTNTAAGVWYTATFGTPTSVTSGTQYALILRPVSAPSAGNYGWIRSSPGTYDNGQRVISTDGGTTWTADATRDFNFKAYMQTGYAASGNLISSLKDANPATGATANWQTLAWTASTPAGTSISFQAAASNNPTGPFNFVGPDGTAGTFFTTSDASLAQFNGFRYLKYKAYLGTTDSAATPVLNDVTISKLNVTPPAFTSADTATFTVGSAGSFPVTASGYPAPVITLTAGALPSGVTFDGSSLAGTPAAGTGGVYNLVFTATNSGGAPTQNFTLTVNEAPAITSANSATFTVGEAGSFTVTASGYPAGITFSTASSLPAGITLAGNGSLSGTPAAGTAGSYPLTISAVNGVAPGAGQNFTLTVNADITAPLVIVSTLSNGAITGNRVLNITGQAGDTGGLATFTINGADLLPEAAGFSHVFVLQAGANVINITATDKSDNTTTITRSITYDATAPALTVTAPADLSLTTAVATDVTGAVAAGNTVHVNVIDPVTNTITDSQDAVVTDTAYTINVGLGNPLNTIEVTVTDPVTSATGSLKRTVVVNLASPSLAVTTPIADSYSSIGAFNLAGTFGDATEPLTIQISADGTTFAEATTISDNTGTFAGTVELTEAKTWPVTVRAAKVSDNSVVAQVKRNIIYSFVDPVTSPTLAPTQIITGIMAAGATVGASSATATIGTADYPTATTWSLPVSGLAVGDNAITITVAETGKPDRTQTVIITLTTEAGLCGSSNGQYFSALPTTGLCLSGHASAITNTGGVLTWTCEGINTATSDNCTAYMPTYTVKFLTNGNGTLDGNANQTVTYRLDASTVTANSGTGAHFVNWTEGATVVSTSPSLTVTNVTANHTFTATFAMDPLAVNYTAGPNGSLTVGAASGQPAVSQTVEYGTDAMTVTAVPNANYHFVNWTEGTTVIGIQPELTVTNITAAHNYTANFALTTFNVTLDQCVTGPTVVTSGDTPTYEFHSAGFDFVAQVNGVSIPSNLFYTYPSGILADQIITATYTPNPAGSVPVRIVRAGVAHDFTTLQAAYDAALNKETIMLLAGTVPGTLSATTAKTVTLKGGYDAAFTSNCGLTRVGPVTLGLGVMLFDRIALP